MPDTKLLTESRDGVLTLTLNRPEKLNAIDNDLSRNLLQALHAAAADESVRVIRLRANGRAFCAGRDVSASPTEDDLVLVQAVAEAIVRHPKLVLAQVHGWTVGAGFEWMLDADVVVAAASTRFKLPEASLGVFVTGGLSATLAATVGLGRAKALTLFGDVFTAHQALDWGMVWKVADDSDLEEASWNAAMKLATLKPNVATQFKRVFNLIGLAAFDRAIQEENMAQRVLGPK
jgi:2-(1,2-epoxy-1,2-dihydrophenyl)acetyl-CoA isomerase